MKLLNVALLCVGLLGLSACKESYDGTLKVYSPMAVNKSNLGAVTVNKGQYPAEIKINSKKKVTLEVKYPAGKVKIPFAVNFDLSKLAPGQKVRLQPAVTGQPFVSEVSYGRNLTRSGEHSGVESCTYEVSEYKCWEETVEADCREIDGRRYCDTRSYRDCGYVPVSYRGSQSVRYYYSYDQQQLKLDVIKNGAVIATLDGSNTDSSKHYTYESDCR